MMFYSPEELYLQRTPRITGYRMTASAPSLSAAYSDIQSEVLTCDICMNHFTKPKMLSCAHTFCESCLEQHINKSQKHTRFYCPLCRKQHKVPSGGVGGFPNNYMVERLIDAFNKKAAVKDEKATAATKGRTPSSPTCHVCYVLHQHMSQPEYRCVECDHLLCKRCVEQHQSNVVTSGHNIVTHDSTEYKVRCTTHPGETLKYYCTTCATCICVLCSLDKHTKHRVSEIPSAAQFFRKKMESSLTKVQDNYARFTTVEHSLDDYANHRTVIAKQIRDISDALHKSISNQTDKLLEQLESAFERSSGSKFKDVKEHVATNRECMDDLQQRTCDLLEDSDDVTFMLQHQSVMSELESYQRIHPKYTLGSARLAFQPKDQTINIGSLGEEHDKSKRRATYH